MKERPILFSGEMVRAILDGRKTQTRRVVKKTIPLDAALVKYGPPDHISSRHRNVVHWFVPGYGDLWPSNHSDNFTCPYGAPGDRLWVRETWDFRDWRDLMHANRIRVAYAADGGQREIDAPAHWNPLIDRSGHWRPSIHMPRWASRITLEITGVRVERLQAISEEDAKAEGVHFHIDGDRKAFAVL